MSLINYSTEFKIILVSEIEFLDFSSEFTFVEIGIRNSLVSSDVCFDSN